ncbi:hypothetical protein ACLMJK_002468 [Lecanora helva]
MASTTLNTFILPPPPFSVRAVELKGSWDNFCQSYKLDKDNHTGHWRGCHAFENIICDGVTLDASSSRNGGLRMGGTYWYYYVLHTIDGDLEYHNAVEPSTSLCPLLPGQQVNILDVPVQEELLNDCGESSTSLDSMVFTLNPTDKFLNLGARQASITSAVKKPNSQTSPIPHDTQPSGPQLSDSESPPKTSASSCVGHSTLDRRQSLVSIFDKLRPTKSAGSNAKSRLAWPRRLLSRNGRLAKTVADDDVPEVPKLPSCFSKRPPALISDGSKSPKHGHSTAIDVCADSGSSNQSQEASVIVPWPQEGIPLGKYHASAPCSDDFVQEYRPEPFLGESGASSRNSSNIQCIQRGVKHDMSAEISNPKIHDNMLEEQGQDRRTGASRHHTDLTVDVSHSPKDNAYHIRPSYESFVSESEAQHRTGYRTSDEPSRLSYAPSENFSPGFASSTTCSGPMSPLHLSQPETPVMSDFGDSYDNDFVRLKRDSQISADFATDVGSFPELSIPQPPSRAPPPPPSRPLSPSSGSLSRTPQPSFGGFQGYSLPSDEHASALTLRKLPSRTLKNSGQSTSPAGKPDLVRSWNDGSKHLLDDLEYLGKMIN